MSITDHYRYIVILLQVCVLSTNNLLFIGKKQMIERLHQKLKKNFVRIIILTLVIGVLSTYGSQSARSFLVQTV